MHKPIKCTMMNIPMGIFQIGLILLMLALRSSPRYDKHRGEVLELGSDYDLEPSSPTPHIEEEDDIDARLPILDQKLMVHNLKSMTL